MVPAPVPAARIPRAVSGVMGVIKSHACNCHTPCGIMGGVRSLETAAQRLAELLTGSATALSEPRGRSDLEFLGEPIVRPLVRGAAPGDVWAVDGGQGLVGQGPGGELLGTRAAPVPD